MSRRLRDDESRREGGGRRRGPPASPHTGVSGVSKFADGGFRALAPRGSAILVATGAFAVFVAFAKGNVVALGPPLALCLGVALWPDRGGPAMGWRLVGARVVAGTALWAVAIVGGGRRASRCLVTDECVGARMERALKPYRDGQLEEAALLLGRLEIPAYLPLRNAQKYHNLGVVLLRLGRTEKAYEALVASLKYDPANAEAYRLLVRIAERSGRRDEAEKWRAKIEERAGAAR